MRGARGRDRVRPPARDSVAGERDADRERGRLRAPRPRDRARRLVEHAGLVDLRRDRRRRAAVEVRHPLPRPAHLQPVEHRARPLLPPARAGARRAAGLLVGPHVAVARARARDHRRRRLPDPPPHPPPGDRPGLLGRLRGRDGGARCERSRDDRALVPRAGRGLDLLADPRVLARGPRLPLLHDHRPEDDAREPRGAARLRGHDRAPGDASDRASDDRVREQGRAARGIGPRLRGAPAARVAPPRARDIRIPPSTPGRPRARRGGVDRGGGVRRPRRPRGDPGALRRRDGRRSRFGAAPAGDRRPLEHCGLGDRRRDGDADRRRRRRRPPDRGRCPPPARRGARGDRRGGRVARRAAAADPRLAGRHRRRPRVRRRRDAPHPRARRGARPAGRGRDARRLARELTVRGIVGDGRVAERSHALSADVRARARRGPLPDRRRARRGGRRGSDAGGGPGRPGRAGRLRRSAPEARLGRGRPRLPPVLVRLHGHPRRSGGDDGRRGLLARLRPRRLDGPLRRELLLGARRRQVEAGGRPAAERALPQREGQVRRRRQGLARRRLAARERLRRRRLRPRRAHRPLRHVVDLRRAPLERRRRHVHGGRPRCGDRRLRLARRRGRGRRERRRAS